MRETKDIVRQITVAASAVFALIGAFVGSGAAGGTRSRRQVVLVV